MGVPYNGASLAGNGDDAADHRQAGLLERGMPIEHIQKFLGHAKLETTQIYAESSAEMIKASYQRALAG
jgi:site-specific recombinase XerD